MKYKTDTNQRDNWLQKQTKRNKNKIMDKNVAVNVAFLPLFVCISCAMAFVPVKR